MSHASFLIDTSALVRVLRDQAALQRWQEQITAGLVAICPIVQLEFLYTAKSKADREELIELVESAFVWVPMPEHVFTRAADLQALLTGRGWHRSAGAVDLLVAATALAHRLTLLHYDHDFDQVVRVSGQPAQWLAEAGTLC